MSTTSWVKTIFKVFGKAAPVLVVLLVFGVAVHASAQTPSYSPSRPTLSPYLYLTKPQLGPLPNYQTYVQPLKNQQTTNQVQQTQITQLQQSQQQLQQTQLGASTVAPTGVGSTFNSTSHYYPTAGGGAGRARGARR